MKAIGKKPALGYVLAFLYTSRKRRGSEFQLKINGLFDFCFKKWIEQKSLLSPDSTKNSGDAD
ncbi:hypothetical protein E0Y62_01130 [Cytobacillus praedii]|uniref:Uncharacterized protein n=1 Tax=Cytobacillus praedii TaxID=1742358 RepID=A0A4R1B1X4_9BACI|nr:hypothetical protein E0Y62_01130 [Cytobacillus praedii]